MYKINVYLPEFLHQRTQHCQSKELTSSLSKYCMSSGFKKGRFPEGWSLTLFIVLSSVCMWNPVIPPKGVGVAVSLRAGVRIGT